MENQTTPPVDHMPSGQESVPNSTATLVLGILSIIFCWCYGVVGLVLGIIGLFLAKKGGATYRLDHARYKESSYNNLKAGRITSIIGVILSVLYLAIAFIVMAFYPEITDDYRDFLEKIQEE